MIIFVERLLAIVTLQRETNKYKHQRNEENNNHLNDHNDSDDGRIG